MLLHAQFDFCQTVFDSLKNRRARTVPLIAAVVPIIERWAAGQSPSEWLFHAPEGGPLREANWKRSVRWREAVAAIGHPTLRVMICDTPRHRCGWVRVRIRRLCKGSWDMDQRR